MTQRSDSTVSMPSPAAMTSRATPNRTRVAEETAHRPPRRLDRRLAVAGRVEPGAMHAGDLAVEIGDGGDHRGPDLKRRTIGVGR